MSTKSTAHGNSHTTHAAPASDEAPAPTPAKVTKSAPQPAPPVIAAATNLTSAQVTTMIAQLDAMTTLFGPEAAPLTIEERRKLLKMRPGGESQVTSVMQVADRYGLVIPGVSSADVAANLELSKNIGTLIARFQSVLGLAVDTSLKAQSRIWSSGTKAYTTLARLVPEYPALQRELTPMASFLAVKYKDAPTSLRSQEKKTLAKARRARSGKKAAAAAGAAEAPAAGDGPQAEPEAAPAAPQAAAAAPAAAAPKPVTNANAPS